MKTCTNVPSNFGRYIAIAEYLLFDRTIALSWSNLLGQAMIQPNYFFVDTIKKIHAGNGQRGEGFETPEGIKKYKNINTLLSSIVDSFPSEGLPARFTLSEQSIIMTNYYQQKNKLYETIEKKDTREL